MADNYYSLDNTQANKLRLNILNETINPVSQTFVSKSGIRQGMKVLDIACGNGVMSCWLAECVGEQGSVTAIDLNPQNIELSKQTAKEKKLNNIEFKVMSAYDLTELKEKFNCVYHRFLFMHLTNPIAALKAMYACLKKGGILLSEISIVSHCYSDPPCESYDYFIKLLKQLLSAQGKDYDVGKTTYSLLAAAAFNEIQCNLTQPLLTTEHSKLMMALSLKIAKAPFLQAGIIDEKTIDEVFEKLIIEQKKDGLWAMPSLCQAYATK